MSAQIEEGMRIMTGGGRVCLVSTRVDFVVFVKSGCLSLEKPVYRQFWIVYR